MVLGSHMVEDCCCWGLLHIVGWPREWCYCRSHGDIAIRRHGLLNHLSWLSWLMRIRYGMFSSDDTWLIHWRFLWKDHAVLDDDVKDHNVMTMVFSHMIWCEWFCVTAWRYDKCWDDSWKVMIRLFLLRKRSKLILMRSRGWVYMRHTLSQVDDIYIFISWELMMEIYMLLV